jgi:hypothetical protein
MEITYTIEPRDIIAFNKRQFETSPSNRRSYRTGYLWIAAASILFGLVTTAWQNWLTASAWLVFTLSMLLLYHPLVYHSLRSIPTRMQEEGRNRGVFGPHKISLHEKELVETSEAGEGRWWWSAVERVVQDQNYIYIYTTAISAHVIPKRAFTDPVQAQAFLREAQALHERAMGADQR